MANTQQIDLFAPPLLAGLDYAADFLSEAEEANLIEQINAAPLTPFRFQQWTAARQSG